MFKWLQFNILFQQQQCFQSYLQQQLRPYLRWRFSNVFKNIIKGILALIIFPATSLADEVAVKNQMEKPSATVEAHKSVQPAKKTAKATKASKQLAENKIAEDGGKTLSSVVLNEVYLQVDKHPWTKIDYELFLKVDKKNLSFPNEKEMSTADLFIATRLLIVQAEEIGLLSSDLNNLTKNDLNIEQARLKGASELWQLRLKQIKNKDDEKSWLEGLKRKFKLRIVKSISL